MSDLEAILRSPSYRMAYEDLEFIRRDELRPVRLQLELLKAEMVQREQRIDSTIVVFGSARALDPEAAAERLEGAHSALARDPDDATLQGEVRRAQRAVEHSRYYAQAREFGRIVSSTCQVGDRCEFVIVTGGGPGIMEAANRGAHDVGAKTVGMNIVLPHEQRPNPYLTPELCFNFHYFAIRKMHFLLRAKALVALPGGFGTFDELFEALTLIQTGKMPRIPVVLLGKRFWERVVHFKQLVEEGVISREDLELFRYAETAQEAWSIVSDFHQRQTPG